ncbi:MAG: tetratricopeptide repeat protein [Acidobacteria bacterium]|nr:tetratricopeptide repeat protein [Acidobacteriota bacterium]
MSGLSAQWLWFFDDQLVHSLSEINPGDQRLKKRAAAHPSVVDGVRFWLEGRREDAIDALGEAVRQNDLDAIALTGQIQFEMGAMPEALHSFTNLASRHPDHPCATVNMGLCHARLSNWPEAIACLQRALMLHPDRVEIWFALGVSLMNEKRLAESRAAFSHSLRLNEAYAPALFGLAVCYHLDGKPADALRIYERLMEGQPVREQILTNAMAAAADAQNPAKVREMASRMLQLQPRSIEPHLALAYVALQQNNLEEAAAHCDRAGNAVATLFEHHYNYAVCLLHLRRFHPASEAFENALRLRPNDVDACEGLAQALTELGHETEARKAWQRLAERRPDREDAWFHIGMLAAEKEDAVEAVRAFERCVRLKPEWMEAWTNLGSARWTAGNLEGAREAFQRVLDAFPFHATARRCMAALAVARADAPAAEKYLEGLSGVDWEILYNLAALHHEQGNLERAAQLYRQVLRVNPECMEARFNLGSVLFGLGRIDESQAYWKSAVAGKPEFARHFLNWIGADPLALPTPTL